MSPLPSQPSGVVNAKLAEAAWGTTARRTRGCRAGRPPNRPIRATGAAAAGQTRAPERASLRSIPDDDDALVQLVFAKALELVP